MVDMVLPHEPAQRINLQTVNVCATLELELQEFRQSEVGSTKHDRAGTRAGCAVLKGLRPGMGSELARSRTGRA
jgi:hypothetical protein